MDVELISMNSFAELEVIGRRGDLPLQMNSVWDDRKVDCLNRTYKIARN